MANNSSEELTSVSLTRSNRVRRRSGMFYCHVCLDEVEPCMPEYTCSLCGGGFIEPLNLEESNEVENMEVSEPTGRPMRRGMRRTRIAIHRFQTGNTPHTNLQTFMQQFMSGLTGGIINEDQNRQLNIQIAPFIINSGDFVFSRNGLDNIITMLMNQLDNTGPPPATKEVIETLPTMLVQQDVVDKNMQCHICMEDFVLEEELRKLPCQHIYHNDCILPWLELHGTCPICRSPLDPTENLTPIIPPHNIADVVEPSMTEIMDATNDEVNNIEPVTGVNNSATVAASEPMCSYNDDLNLD